MRVPSTPRENTDSHGRTRTNTDAQTDDKRHIARVVRSELVGRAGILGSAPHSDGVTGCGLPVCRTEAGVRGSELRVAGGEARIVQFTFPIGKQGTVVTTRRGVVAAAWRR